MLITKNGQVIKYLKPAQGSLVVKAKAKIIFEKPRISINDPRYKTVNDRCAELQAVLKKLAMIKGAR